METCSRCGMAKPSCTCSRKTKCSRCNGTGYYTIKEFDNTTGMYQWKNYPCSACNKTGWVWP